MKSLNLKRTVITSAVVSLVLVTPLLVMESVNRVGQAYEFPFALYLFLWVAAAAFFVILLTLVRGLRDGGHAVPMVVRAVFLVAIGAVWVTLVSDQMPCFLGVPNCD